MGLFASALTEQVREPRAAAVVTSINASVQALESLFNELLEISKLDSGIIKPHDLQQNVVDIRVRLLDFI